MLPTSVISSLLGDVEPNMVFGEKTQLSQTFFPKEPIMGSYVVHPWNVTKLIFTGH